MFILVAFLSDFLLVHSFQGTKAFKVRFVFSSEFHLARLSTNLENRRKQRKGTSVSFYVSSCLLRRTRSSRLNVRNRISNVATSEGNSQSGLKISSLFSWLGFTPWRNSFFAVSRKREIRLMLLWIALVETVARINCCFYFFSLRRSSLGAFTRGQRMLVLVPRSCKIKTWKW